MQKPRFYYHCIGARPAKSVDEEWRNLDLKLLFSLFLEGESIANWMGIFSDQEPKLHPLNKQAPAGRHSGENQIKQIRATQIVIEIKKDLARNIEVSIKGEPPDEMQKLRFHCHFFGARPRRLTRNLDLILHSSLFLGGESLANRVEYFLVRTQNSGY